MNKQTVVFEIETIEAGQRRKYGDSYFHFIVTNKSDINYADFLMKSFCMSFVRKSFLPDEMPNMFSPKCTLFDKKADRTFVYKVEEASTD